VESIEMPTTWAPIPSNFARFASYVGIWTVQVGVNAKG